MSRNDRTDKAGGRAWGIRPLTVMIAFLAIIGLLLAYEHRAHVLAGEGWLIALLVVCVVMHLFMHGGHGGGHDNSQSDDRS